MVMKRKSDHGCNGFQVPVIPRAPRSARRRAPPARMMENNQNCAFELLASIAGKLLLESESSASSNASDANEHLAFGIVKQEQENMDTPAKVECLDHGSSEESVFASKLATKNNNEKTAHKGMSHDESDANMECTSNVSSSNCAHKFSSDLKSVNLESKAISGGFPCKVEEASPDCGDRCISNVGNDIRRQLGVEKGQAGVQNTDNLCSAKDNNANLCSSAKLTLGWAPVHSSYFSRRRNYTNLGFRDDDEKFSRYKSTVKYKALKPPTRVGDRRIRKLLTSKYWKAAPRLKDSEFANTVKWLRHDRGLKAVCNKRKDYYSREKYQYHSLCKKRKRSNNSSMVISEGGFSSESVSNSPEKQVNRDTNSLATSSHGVNGKSSSVTNHQSSCHSKDSNVKFSIKSFKIPELYIEVPESATVGSLKRTVVEAVTALLGGGLRVGVLLQGKKVRDDNRTLLQSGITRKENLDTLGFTLEPNPTQVPPPVHVEDPALLQCDNPQPVNRSEPVPVLDPVNSDAPPETSGLLNAGDMTDSNHETVCSLNDALAEKAIADSKALVPVTPVGVEPLAVVPPNPKTKRSELVQRRTRRPFSVAEVEALVQAVEELGTGRWRDVKLRAFENAEHRTYVDLKDKWKTLVHTATISPQQRRGEPVPQELLDRVLAAHSYWSQSQPKSQLKHQVGNLKITEGPAERSSVAAPTAA